jgi:F-type H+-transporting ATPase subunit epsilon
MTVDITEPVRNFSFDDIDKVRAEGETGWFTLLQNHIDCTSSLVPGIIELVRASGGPVYAGIDEAVLVKEGETVMIAAGKAVTADNFEDLVETVEQQFKAVDERDRKLRSVLTKLETELSRGLMEDSSV